MNTGKRMSKAEKRQYAVEELQESEETYVEQLRLLFLVYVSPMAKHPNITPEQHSTLFSQIKIILNFNTNFLNNLRDEIKQGESIAQELLNFCPYFKLYREYVNNYEQASILLRTLKNRPWFIELDKDGRSRCHNLALSDLLVTPIQRVPRYPMLIKEIIKNTAPNHPDLNLLKSALEKYTALNRHINEGIKEQEKRDKVREIGEQVLQGGKPISLVAPARVFIMKGELWKVCRGKNKKYMFFLFNDLLIYTKPQGKNYKFHNKLEINTSFHSEPVDEVMYPPHSIQINTITKSFVVFADHQEEYLTWLKAMQDIKEQQIEREKLKGNYVPCDIRKAPVMVPNHFFDDCQVCNSKFTLIRRRHHCRICGNVVCGNCSNGRLLNSEEEMVRACDNCIKEAMSGKNVFKNSSISSRTSSVRDSLVPIEADNVYREGTPDASSELSSIKFYHGLIASKTERKKVLENRERGSFFIAEADECLLLVYKSENNKVQEIKLRMKFVDGMSISYTCDNHNVSSSSIEDLVKRKLWKVLGLTKAVPSEMWPENPKIEDSEACGRCVALFNYEAKAPGDLTLNKGDEILILDRSKNEGWWTGKIGESIGQFPSNFTKVIDKPVERFSVEAKIKQPLVPKGGDLLIAKQDFKTSPYRELSFSTGDVIILQKTDQSGWWLGRLQINNKLGWFPPALVERLER